MNLFQIRLLCCSTLILTCLLFFLGSLHAGLNPTSISWPSNSNPNPNTAIPNPPNASPT